MVRKYLTPVAVVVVTLLCTANKCEDSNSGNSGGSTTTTTYEFESVNLRYDFSSRHNTWTNMYADAGDLYQAHGTNPTELKGVITILR